MTEEDHEKLWTCYQTGQMNEGQLQQHMDEDKDFAAFVEKKRAERRA